MFRFKEKLGVSLSLFAFVRRNCRGSPLWLPVGTSPTSMGRHRGLPLRSFCYGTYL